VTAKASTEQLIERMKSARGYVYPAHQYIAEADPDFLEVYNNLAGAALLHEGHDDGTHALPAKYREMVVCAVLAYRGSVEGVATHAKRAIALGATEQELFEAFQATMIPGGAPTFLAGVRALMSLK
jgi:AhpD family alkylhydroperoxidase